MQWSRLAGQLCEWILVLHDAGRVQDVRRGLVAQVAADVPTVFHSWGRYKKEVEGVGALDELSLCDQL